MRYSLPRGLCLVVLLLLFCTVGYAQNSLPVIRANSLSVNIQDGEYYSEGDWTIVPEAKPDVYTTSSAGKMVTFYTDLDSISYKVTKDGVFDFVILVNGKDSAFTQIIYEKSTLDVLKEAGPYVKASTDENIPKFTYQSADAEPLRRLRETYKLDSIAGEGNDVSKMLNLMRWVHNSIEHNGNKGNPSVKNAEDLMKTCSNQQGTLNCRGLGIVLNEVYLAMGMPSRFVTCSPKDTADFDCHVINMVFSYDLDKWLWMDPTQNSYIMSETGELLAIEEVRDRLINGGTLIVNPDANWNYRGTTDKPWYLDYYMAKNLYWFSSPLHSTYDYETNDGAKEQAYLELYPSGFLPDTKRKLVQTYRSGMKRTTYVTNNDSIFWAKPEKTQLR